MGLSSLQLDAFFAAARALNFSRAAIEIHITQSALTQRIGNLEGELGVSLFVRKPRGVELTDAGRRLLRYAQTRDLLEGELLEELTGKDVTGLGGIVRIGGFSSIMRSVVLPALAPLARDNPRVQLHLTSAEMGDLSRLLLTSEVDLVIAGSVISHADVENVPLGEEDNVLVASSTLEAADVYLDHDPEDPTTARFLRSQSESGAVPSFRRSYLDEIYALMDGAALGLGKAVVPRHLAERDERLRIVPGQKPLRTPVVLHYFRQPFYTALHKAVVAELAQRAALLLRVPEPRTNDRTGLSAPTARRKRRSPAPCR